MALREILTFPHPTLRAMAAPVTAFDEQLSMLIDDMFETMYDAPGIGLAATQIGVKLRVAVIDVSEDKSERFELVNPEIVSFSGESEMEEGCLSLPGIHETVKRPEKVVLKAQNRSGEKYEIETEGLLATCIQHEIDHLDGKLFIDYLSMLKARRIRKKMEKQQRQKGP